MSEHWLTDGHSVSKMALYSICRALLPTKSSALHSEYRVPLGTRVPQTDRQNSVSLRHSWIRDIHFLLNSIIFYKG
jgi:hypothetical protein